MTIRRTYQLKNRLGELERLFHEIETFAREKNIALKCQNEIQLAVEEHFANVVTYGFSDTAEHIITVKLVCEDNVVEITMEDDGKPFNPLNFKPQDISLPPEEREIGGLGIFLTRKCMDDITYQRKNKKNILKLKKYI